MNLYSTYVNGTNCACTTKAEVDVISNYDNYDSNQLF